MTNEQLELIGRELERIYGDSLPNPEHCPREFSYILKLYMYYNFEKA
jgi:hypothetical protein